MKPIARISKDRLWKFQRAKIFTYGEDLNLSCRFLSVGGSGVCRPPRVAINQKQLPSRIIGLFETATCFVQPIALKTSRNSRTDVERKPNRAVFTILGDG